MHLCAKTGPPEILEELVRLHPESPRHEIGSCCMIKYKVHVHSLYSTLTLSWKYRDDQTPLHNVIWDSVGERLLEKAKILLCHSDDWARLQGMLDGRTPMHWASAWNKLDLLGLLIEDDKRKSSMRKSSCKKTYKVRNKV